MCRWVNLCCLSVLDSCHVTRYILVMIKTFADKDTAALYTSGKSRRVPPDLVSRALRRLEYIDLAVSLDDLKVPPSNRLHALKDDRSGQYSISINDQWRICFAFLDGDACDVEITDYH
jgi:proteic killer suppression protein